MLFFPFIECLVFDPFCLDKHTQANLCNFRFLCNQHSTDGFAHTASKR